jgi:hypothetical protein
MAGLTGRIAAFGVADERQVRAVRVGPRDYQAGYNAAVSQAFSEPELLVLVSLLRSKLGALSWLMMRCMCPAVPPPQSEDSCRLWVSRALLA